MFNSSKRKKRREKSKHFKTKEKDIENHKQNIKNKPITKKKGFFSIIEEGYIKQYKKIIIVPILILLFSFIIIGMKITTTGDFIEKGVSLKGGTTITIQPENTNILSNLNTEELRKNILNKFPDADINTRRVTSGNELTGIAVDVDIKINEIDTLIDAVKETIPSITSEDYVVESIGASLGDSFFKEIIRVLIIAFISMAIVVFLYFKVPLPSFYVILSAVTDIVVTIAVVDLFNIKLSTAGIAAFLMLVGYSVDTDILLTIRVLKNKKGTTTERMIDAMKTGLTMSITTIIAVTFAFFFANSDTIRQIMLILIIGLLVDIISTWMQNAPLLRWYLKTKKNDN